MVVSINEIMDLIIMTLAIGFIFKDAFPKPASKKYDPVQELRNAAKGAVDYGSFLFAALIAAPGIILHEMAHKFVALFFGVQAVFHAAYTWLFIGVFLKMLNFGFIFFVPGYVEYPAASVTLIQSAIIAVSGPLINLILFAGAWAVLKHGKVKDKNKLLALHLTKNINLFLFIFNMIPIPPFDGYSFFYDLYRMLFG